MQFVFIDEIQCTHKDPKFYGLGAAVFNYYTYHKFKEAFCRAFSELGWDPGIEFKGKHLFSQDGDKTVGVEKRIDFINTITQEMSSGTNSRIKYYCCTNYNGDGCKNHLSILEKLIAAIRPTGSGFKKMIAFYLDRNTKIDKDQIVLIINRASSGIIFERPFIVESGNQLPGIIAVDVLNYLQSWIQLSPKESDQLSLFAINQRNKEKLDQVKKIISQVKNVKQVKY